MRKLKGPESKRDESKTLDSTELNETNFANISTKNLIQLKIKIPTDPDLALRALLKSLEQQSFQNRNRNAKLSRQYLFAKPGVYGLNDFLMNQLLKACNPEQQEGPPLTTRFLDFFNRKDIHTLIDDENIMLLENFNEFFSYFPELLNDPRIQVLRQKIKPNYKWIYSWISQFVVTSEVPSSKIEKSEEKSACLNYSWEDLDGQLMVAVKLLQESGYGDKKTTAKAEQALQLLGDGTKQNAFRWCKPEIFSLLIEGIIQYLSLTKHYTESIITALNRCLAYTVNYSDIKKVVDFLLLDIKGSVLIYICKEDAQDSSTIFCTYRTTGTFPNWEKEFGSPISLINYLVENIFNAPIADENIKDPIIEALLALTREKFSGVIADLDAKNYILPDYEDNHNAHYEALAKVYVHMNAIHLNEFMLFIENQFFGSKLSTMVFISNIDRHLPEKSLVTRDKIIDLALKYMKDHLNKTQRLALSQIKSGNFLNFLNSQKDKVSLSQMWEAAGRAIANLSVTDRAVILRKITKLFLEDEILFDKDLEGSIYSVSQRMQQLCAALSQGITKYALEEALGLGFPKEINQVIMGYYR